MSKKSKTKKKSRAGRPPLDGIPRVNRLYSIPDGVADEFRRVTHERGLNMSQIVSSLIHDWLCKNQNATEDLPSK